MAYTVLARRYRSGTFDEVIGQDHVAQTLKRAIQSGRIAHAYLFTGTRGVGKTSMARILAKALNCLKADAPTTEPCGQCSSCQAIARGEDIDVIEIDAASNTGVDNVRDIIENARFRPARARFKVYIIDEVHMLSKQAFNALLKIMEEPPEHVKFILATTEAEKILPTILSRCQRYDFRNIPSREIVGHLQRIVNEEKVEATDEALQLVARAGAGSMRDSLSLLDRLLSVGETKVTAETIEQLLGMPRATLIFELAGAIGAGDVKATLSQATKVVNGGLAVDTLIASLIEHFHNLLVLNTCGADSELVDIVGVNAAELDAQAKRFDPAVLTQDITILEELRRQMRSSQTGRALLDATLARLAMSNQFASVGELIARLDGNGAPTRPGGARTGAPGAAPTAQKKTPDLAGGSMARGPQLVAIPIERVRDEPAADAPRGTKPSLAEPEAATARPAPRGTISEPAPPEPSPGTPGEGRVRGGSETTAVDASIASHAVETASGSTLATSLDPAGSATTQATTAAAPAFDAARDETPPSAILDPQSEIPSDDADALPAVGKVADASATSSLWQAFAKKGAPKPAAPTSHGPGATKPGDEPEHLRAFRDRVTPHLKKALVGMLESGRLLSVEESTGQVVLWFAHGDAFAGEYVLTNVGAYQVAFEAVLGRPARLEVQIEPAPPEPARRRDDRSAGPKVVRPTIQEVEASGPAPASGDATAPVAVDLTQYTSDPLVKAILEQFPNARVYPPR